MKSVIAGCNETACKRGVALKLCVIGAGYVGLVSGVCFAALGNTVVCVDQNEDKILQLRAGGVPIYEPGLKALIKDNVEQGRLSFTTDTAASVEAAEIVILAVGTPSLPGEKRTCPILKKPPARWQTP